MAKTHKCGLIMFICFAIVVCTIVMGQIGSWDILMDECSQKVFIPIFMTIVVVIGGVAGFVIIVIDLNKL